MPRWRVADRQARGFRLVVVLAMLCSHGCRHDEGADGSALTVHVSAASSLREAMPDIKDIFASERPKRDVRLNFAGSQALRLQIEHGSPAHVFVSADKEHVDALERAGLLWGVRQFAGNKLTVISAPSPIPIASLPQLAAAETLVVGTHNAPIGRYTERFLAKVAATRGAQLAVQIRSRIVSREPNARLVRAKVELGEAAAAIVYRTDALASASTKRGDLPDELQVQAELYVGLTERARECAECKAFVATLLGRKGQAALEKRGFKGAQR